MFETIRNNLYAAKVNEAIFCSDNIEWIFTASIVSIFAILLSVKYRERSPVSFFITMISAPLVVIFSLYTAVVVLYNQGDTELQLAMEHARLEDSKARRAQELKDAQTRIKIAKVRAENMKLTTQGAPDSTELIQAKAELARLQAGHRAQVSSAPPSTSREPGAPIDDQRRLVLSGLWLGACFFLQRVFEKLFKDKGYALLTVCAAGFLLAFFTANYFLLGGSVTGGLMGAAGDRT